MGMKPRQKQTYVIDMRRDQTAESRYAVATTKAAAQKKLLEFAASYGFVMRDGRLYDPDYGSNEVENFAIFDASYEDGLPVYFCHADGSGPWCRVERADD